MTRSLTALFVLALTAPAAAQFGPANPGRGTVALEAEHPTLAPGQTTDVAVTFTIDPGWHIYWLNAGSTGSPTVLKFQAPSGLSVGEPAWPGPHRYPQKALDTVDFVYEKTATVLVPVTVAKTAKPGAKLTLTLKSEWFACDANMCVDGRGEAKLELTVATQAPKPDEKRAARFAAARKRLPTPLPKEVAARFVGTVLKVDVPKATRLAWYPLRPQTCDPVSSLKDGEAEGSTLKVRYPKTLKKEKQVTGLLAVTRGKRIAYHWLTVAVPKPTK